MRSCVRAFPRARAHNDYYYRTSACQVRSCTAPNSALLPLRGGAALAHAICARVATGRDRLTVRPPVRSLALSLDWYGMKRSRLGHTSGVCVCTSNVSYYCARSSTVANACVSKRRMCMSSTRPHALPHNSNTVLHWLIRCAMSSSVGHISGSPIMEVVNINAQ